MTKDQAFREASRILESVWAFESPHISQPRDALLLPSVHRIAVAKQECFCVLTLNGAHCLIKFHVISKGLVNRTVVHPREVFRPCLFDNAVACIILHNHPSGRLNPSPEDREITAHLHDASDIMNITILDHLIVSKQGYFSFVEHGLLEPVFSSLGVSHALS